MPPGKSSHYLIVPLLLVIAGCSEMGYYSQAISGHFALMHARQPVTQLLAAPTTAAPLRQQLLLSRELLEFAQHILGLPDNGSYQSFVQAERPFVVWNVFAAPALSLQARQWCVPLVVGCTSYRGWFDPDRANAQAVKLRQQGYDTFVGGVTAYSTLGWFSDPLLSTFFGQQQWHTAALLFHELAHQQLYVANDTLFNESFAVTVEREGTRRWLLSHGNRQQRRDADRYWQRQDQRAALFAGARQALQTVYAGNATDTFKRQQKAAIFKRLSMDSGWNNTPSAPLNNATLAAYAAYTTLVPAFQSMLPEQGESMRGFFQRAAALAQQSQPERQQALLALLNAPARPH